MMESHRKTVLVSIIVLITIFLCIGCQENKTVYIHEDAYLQAPAVPVMPDTRMKSAVARPLMEASRGVGDINDRELYLLAKMIECEARYEPYEGKVAVGSVILNRVKSSRFPNTVEGVIFQKGQFQPMVDGGWESKEPSALAFKAAKEALKGKKPVGNNGQTVGNALFFIYEELASESAIKWFKNNLRYITTIGNHDFYTY
jgi:N-acetylmuramoyl-L-alanine amidase